LVVGLTLIELVVWPPGLQRKVPPAVAGVAVKVAVCPAQILGLFTLTPGGVPMVTVTWSWLVQPFAVAVRVYVVFVVGVAVVLSVLVLDKVALGLQVTVGVMVPAQPVIGTLTV